jgi:hypothetical protein
VDKGILVRYLSIRKAYKCFDIRLNKVLDSINVMFDDTSGWKIKEEEKESKEWVHEEESKEEEVAEEEDEEEKLEGEEKEQKDIQVPPKTPRRRIQKNHPSN